MSNLMEVVVVQVLHPTNRLNPEQWVFLHEDEAKDKYDELLSKLPEGSRIHISKQPVIFSILNTQL